MSDRHFKDIWVQGFTDEYGAVRFEIYRDSSFGLDDIQKTTRLLYLDAKSCSSETGGRIAGARRYDVNRSCRLLSLQL